MSPEQRLIRTMVQSFAEIIERQVLRFENQSADYERKLAEHRTSFAARTSADEKIIEWLRIKVQDARAERDALRAEVAALQERLRASIARGDFAQMEVAALKSQTPKQHPVKVGEWVVRTAEGAQLAPIGTVAQVVSVADGLPDGYEYVIAGWRWHSDYCEPCDPPATHDTVQGKAAAESVIRDGRKTEPVADEIKAGDLVEVVSSTHKIYTEPEDIGRRGVVTAIDGMRISVEAVPGYKLPISGIIGKCDVRKVTT